MSHGNGADQYVGRGSSAHCNLIKHMQIDKAPANSESIFIYMTTCALQTQLNTMSPIYSHHVTLFDSVFFTFIWSFGGRNLLRCNLEKNLHQLDNTCTANTHNTTKWKNVANVHNAIKQRMCWHEPDVSWYQISVNIAFAFWLLIACQFKQYHKKTQRAFKIIKYIQNLDFCLFSNTTDKYCSWLQ